MDVLAKPTAIKRTAIRFVTPGERKHGIQEDSSAQATKAAGPHAEYANASTTGKNKMDQGPLALELRYASMGMGIGALEQIVSAPPTLRSTEPAQIAAQAPQLHVMHSILRSGHDC